MAVPGTCVILLYKVKRVVAEMDDCKVPTIHFISLSIFSQFSYFKRR